MKVERKRVEAEGERFKRGEGDGILAFCSGSYKEIYFKTESLMNASPHRAKVMSFSECVLIDNKPIPIKEGDWIIDGQVWNETDFHRNWIIKRAPRKKDEERTENKVSDNQGS